MSIKKSKKTTNTNNTHLHLDAENFLKICRSNHHPAVKKIKKHIHFWQWATKLFLPSFLFSRPNLGDNIKVLFKHSNFKPLRLAIFCWIVFTITVAITGALILLKTPSIQASTPFSIQTGYYVGTGQNLTISGLSFSPELVIIKSDSSAGSAIWKSNVMPSNESSYLINTANNTEGLITFSSDGFSVSSTSEVNSNGIRYTWTAFAGSDCTVTGTMCIGSYTGDGSTLKSVATGFAPDLTWVKRTTAVSGTFRTSTMPDDEGAYFTSTANNTSGVLFKTLDTSGFTVGTTNNTLGGLFYFVSFKNTTGKIIVDSFVGNGTDNRNITMTDTFKPNFVLVKSSTAVTPTFNNTHSWGDYSHLTTSTANAVNNIQELRSDGFQVGTSSNVNSSGITYNYFAFGGSSALSPSGTFLMEHGSYTGNGSNQSITGLGFSPDLIIIKGNTAQYGVFSTILDNNRTYYFATSSAGFSDGITSLDANGFSVGAHSTVNSNLITYEYIAFGNASLPNKLNQASDFFIGAHTGNGISGRSIEKIGLSPDMVTAKRASATALAGWRSSNMSANGSSYFSATAEIGDGSIFQTLDSDGFTIGSSSSINTAGSLYIWFGFKNSANFKAGSYTGNGTSGTNISSIGFDPDYVWVKNASSVRAAHLSNSTSISSGDSMHLMNLANASNMITDLTTDAFTVGSASETNSSGATYRYIAWHKEPTDTPPITPINSTPANNATNVNLNPTISASTYSDPETDPHVNTQWQIDDNADFSSPVWTRTSGSAETSTTVNSLTGTFANELAGKTELTHNTKYYLQARYSDGQWSSWSTDTYFTTNQIETPINNLPEDGATVLTLNPILTTSNFTDAQTGHESLSAQWQINGSSDFTTTLYDSAEIAYSNSFAVPNAILSNLTTYFWRVRYKDSSGFWSNYSTPTKFLVSKTEIQVDALSSNLTTDPEKNINLDAQIKLTDGSALDDAVVKIDIFNPDGEKIATAKTMDYLSGSDGIYRYSLIAPTQSGNYVYEVIASWNDKTGYGAGNFIVNEIKKTTPTITPTTDTKSPDTKPPVTDGVDAKIDDLKSQLQINETNRLQSYQQILDRLSQIDNLLIWGVIPSIILGLILLIIAIFELWRYQTILSALAMGVSKKELKKYFGKSILIADKKII